MSERRVAVQTLSHHGVAQGDITSITTYVGPAFPAGVRNPSDVLLWFFFELPWGSLHPLIRVWLGRAAGRGRVLEDRRMHRVFSLLVDEPDKTACFEALKQLDGLVDTLERVRGIEGRDFTDRISHPQVDAELRAWYASASIGFAAMAAINYDSQTIATRLSSAAAWMGSQLDDDRLRVAELDAIVCDLAGAAATWFGALVWTRREVHA